MAQRSLEGRNAERKAVIASFRPDLHSVTHAVCPLSASAVGAALSLSDVDVSDKGCAVHLPTMVGSQDALFA